MFHMKHFTSETQKKGKYGEKICKKYLLSAGYDVIEENFSNSMGEIDLICTKNNRIYLIEVKSVMYNSQLVSHETYNPFENITKKKINKLKRCFFSYLRYSNVSYETFHFIASAVKVDLLNIKHQVSFLEII